MSTVVDAREGFMACPDCSWFGNIEFVLTDDGPPVDTGDVIDLIHPDCGQVARVLVGVTVGE